MNSRPLRKPVASPDMTLGNSQAPLSGVDQQPRRSRIKDLEVMVAEVIRETPEVATLVLFTGNDRLEYEPGHFLSIRPQQFPALDRFTRYFEDIKGKSEPARAYSLCSAPHERYLAITVKEERYIPGTTRYPPLLSPVLVWRTVPGTRMVVTGFFITVSTPAMEARWTTWEQPANACWTMR